MRIITYPPDPRWLVLNTEDDRNVFCRTARGTFTPLHQLSMGMFKKSYSSSDKYVVTFLPEEFL